MQYYKPDNDRKGKLWGLLAILLYLLLTTTTLLLVKFNFEPVSTEEGIMIDFGDSDSGWGDNNRASSNSQAAAPSSRTPQPDHVTSDRPSDVTVSRPNVQPRPNNTPNPTPTPPQPVERPRQLDPRANFPGTSQSGSNNPQGQGDSRGRGNVGSADGADGGSPTGGGTGPSVQMHGRTLREVLPLPAYNANEEGKVVVNITVNKKGDVIAAEFSPAGSTTQNSQLRNAAIAAARKAKFSSSEDQDFQNGTITYTFRLQ